MGETTGIEWADRQLMTRSEHNRLHNEERGRCPETGRILASAS